MIQINRKLFLKLLKASSPEPLRDVLMGFGVKRGDAMNLAIEIRARYQGIILGVTTQMVTISLPQNIELDFGD